MNIRSFSKYVLTATLVCGYVYPVAAEESQSGRHDDGRAYRTDESGFQIVDHVADLEVTVDDLRRQVRVLEDELDHKQQILQQHAPQPILPGAKLKESDVVFLPQRSIPAKFDISDEATTTNSKGFSALNQQIADLQKLRDALNKQQETQKSQIQQADVKYQQAKVKYQEVEGRYKKSEVKYQEATRENSHLVQKLRAIKAELLKVKAKNVDLVQDLELKDEKVTSIQGKLAKVSETAAAYQVQALQRARLNSSSKIAVTDNTAALNTSEKSSEQAKLNATFKQIQHLIYKRKTLADRLRKNISGVSVSMSVLKTKDGVTLDKLRSSLRSIETVGDAKSIASGIAQIESILKDDISVIKRLSRM